MDRRLLTPAEAALLLAPANSTATKCVQAGLLSLLGAERIAFVKSSGLLSQSALLINPSGTPDTGLLPRHLVALGQALLAYGKGNRLVSSDVNHALRKAFGYGFSGYLRDEVAQGLIERNLLGWIDSKWLGLFHRTTYHRTPGGDALIAPI